MTKSARWTWFVSVVAVVGVALVLAFVLSLVTRGGVFYERHFEWLFWVNAGVAALLLLVVATAAVRGRPWPRDTQGTHGRGRPRQPRRHGPALSDTPVVARRNGRIA